MAPKDQKIAIIGGGLGGMALMNACLYSGLENVHLFEAAAEFTEVGAGVNITRNANRILDAFGLQESMLWKSSRNPPCYMDYRHYRTGEHLGSIGEFGEPQSRQIHRAHLLAALKERIPESKISKGKRLVLIEKGEQDSGYVLHFQDGTSSPADIIVGCDGIKSVVRQHLGFVDKPMYSGQMVYRGYVSYNDLTPETAELLRHTVNFRGPRRHVLTLPIGNEESKTARVGIIGFMTEPLESWTSEAWLAEAPVEDFAEQVKDWTGAVQEIIAGLRKGSNNGNILKQTLYVREPTPKWFHVDDETPDSGIILIGDSVHSTLPHQGLCNLSAFINQLLKLFVGQGACQAIESGFALAQVLKHWKSEDLGAAFQFFQDFRKPRTDRITKSSYETGKMASADIPEELWATTFPPELVRERMKWVMVCYPSFYVGTLYLMTPGI
jgi:salicylate hydroxylase